MNDRSFRLEPVNARMMGVCAGIARSTGIDVTLVRLATVLLTVFGFGLVGVAAYLIAGWLAAR